MLVSASGGQALLAARPSLQKARQMRRKEGRRRIDHARAIVHGVAPQLELQTTTRSCAPATALVELSRTASIVVVGTRGLGRVGSLLLGSVSAAVCARAMCPVAVARPPFSADDDTVGPVVVGIDAGVESAPALEVAFDLASVDGVDLDVVHNWSVRPRFSPSSYLDQLEQRDEHERAMEIALAGFEDTYPDVTVHRHLPQGNPVDTLVILSQTATAVVVGARPAPGRRGSLASVSRAVLENAHAPVVVVRSAAASRPSRGSVVTTSGSARERAGR
jgi:nucleotide-binding universal stress UspA family protein